MTDIEREELLSAYIDDELSAEDRARVESWLSESDELRQLHDELLSLRASIQSLPKHTVDRDVAEGVLHRAAQTASSLAKPAPSAVSETSDERQIVPGSLSWWNRGASARRFLWPALAVAAALAILIYDANQRPDELQVAQAPEASTRQDEEISNRSKIDTQIDSSDRLSPLSSLKDDASTPASVAPRASGEFPSSRDSRAANMPELRPAPGEVTSRSIRGNAEIESMSRGGGNAGQAAKIRPPASPRQQSADQKDSYYFDTPAGDASSALPTFVCTVTPEYFRANEFEKLLKANRIEWKQVAMPKEEPQPEAVTQSNDSKFSPPRTQTPSQQQLYYLRTSGAQANKILSQVPQTPNLYQDKQLSLPRVTAPREKQMGDVEAGIQVLLVAPESTPPAAAPQKSR